MENENNNPNPPTPVQEPPSMSSPPPTDSQQTLGTTPVQPQTSNLEESDRKIKKIIILSLVLFFGGLVVIGVVIGFISGTKDIIEEREKELSGLSEDSTPAKEIIVELPKIENPVLREIDENLAAERVIDGRFDGQGTAYMTFNENNNFHSIQDAEPTRYYDLGEFDTSSAKCFSQSGTEILADSRKRFEGAGYSVHESSVYAGGFGCVDAVMASNGAVVCSVSLSVSDASSSEKAKYSFVIATYCSGEEELNEEKNEYREFYEILVDVSDEFLPKEGEQLQYLPGYVKDSNTEGYRIASDASAPVFTQYYYKKGGAKWVDVTDEGEYLVPCEPDGENAADMLAAFEGEPCGPNGDGIVGS